MVKVLKVFKPEGAVAAIDKSKPFDYQNKIPCNHDSPNLIPKQEEIYKDTVSFRCPFCNHFVLAPPVFYNPIEERQHSRLSVRSVSPALSSIISSVKVNHGQINEKDPMDVFWMGFSRADAQPADISKLKSELNWVEKKVAYGATASPRSGHPGEYDVHLVALPHMKPVLKMVNGVPLIIGTLGGRACRMFRVYVLSSENMIGLPKVHWVNIHGVDLETGEEIVEKVSP